MASSDYSAEVSAAVNKQITQELQASHTYRALSSYFGNPRVAYPGFAAFFAKQAAEEAEHAQAFINYQNERGSFVELGALAGATFEGSPLDALRSVALPLESSVNCALLSLHKIGDERTKVFVEAFLEEQTKSIASLVALVSQVQRLSADGLYVLDRSLL